MLSWQPLAPRRFFNNPMPPNENNPARGQAIIAVAAAAIINAAGECLLARRPPGVPYAGFWEFPGGKFEPDEDARACLARELREELGIEIETAYPWLVRRFAYPEKTVLLHFFRVVAWRGTPHPHEGQLLAWQSPEAVTVAPLLPANAPILRALALPPVYAITPGAIDDGARFLARCDAAFARGLRLLQWRVQARDAQSEALAAELVRRAHATGARVLINSDIALAQRIGADGVQLPARMLAELRTRPPLPLCAASCHNAAELAQALRLECDLAVLSPVLPTPTHPDAAGMGWHAFAALAHSSPLPIYALGGMRADMLATAMQHGAHGIASLSGMWDEGQV